MFIFALPPRYLKINKPLEIRMEIVRTCHWVTYLVGTAPKKIDVQIPRYKQMSPHPVCFSYHRSLIEERNGIFHDPLSDPLDSVGAHFYKLRVYSFSEGISHPGSSPRKWQFSVKLQMNQ